MAWTAQVFTATSKPDYQALNNLRYDTQNWGGAVNAGGHALNNVASILAGSDGAGNAVATVGLTTSPVLIRQQTGNGALLVTDGHASTPKQVSLGMNSSGAFARAELQAIQQGVAAMPILLQPSGGFVGVGALSGGVTAPLHVLGNASGMVARFQSRADAANVRAYVRLDTTNADFWWEWSVEDTSGGGSANGLCFRERSGSGASVPRLYLAPVGAGTGLGIDVYPGASMKLDVAGIIRAQASGVDMRIQPGGAGGALVGSFSNHPVLVYVNGSEAARFGVASLAIGKAGTASKFAVASLPVHADNAAATGAGLTAGDFFRTSTGDVKAVY